VEKARHKTLAGRGAWLGTPEGLSAHSSAIIYQSIPCVSMGSPNPSGGLFLSPDQKGGEKKNSSSLELSGGPFGENHCALN